MNKTNIPNSSGIYIFKNNSSQILYIGKAKNLKKRVQSYFRKSSYLEPGKIQMIQQAAKIEYIKTESELEAFILEATLIKKHKPKYNFQLKDDKNYKYIKIDFTTEDFPKIYFVRNSKIDTRSEKFFGPYVNASAASQLIKFLRRLFQYRTCNREIYYKNGGKKYSKPCLYFHIKLCTGPCIGAISKNEYNRLIKNCVRFLSGKHSELLLFLKKEMWNASSKKDFEKAALIRDQIKNIKEINKIKLERAKLGKEKPEILISSLKKLLFLKKEPKRIEAYDISNIRGTDAVGSMVVFENFEPKKSDYRRFKIKTKSTPDDVAMIKEVLLRRFKHANESQTKERWPIPDLILIDGGRPQLNTAAKVLKQFELNITVIALAKREEEIFTTVKRKSLKLPNESAQLKLLQRIRDEAHRFAIDYHHKLREKSMARSALDNIKGIGLKTRKKLFRKFGSVAGLRSAKRKDVEDVVGRKLAKKLYEEL
ncbi:MAG: hypothetical protein ACD_63C00092G0008 [uncultured bacterium]|nr:MAG: hypothetical protein ACD_63C00092G0008 [uncultured bacterium]